jgi:uncharacterized integral membrane protein (TIGR00698 family)
MAGILAAAAVAVAALAAARIVPLVGAPVLALALGIAVAAVHRPSAALVPGIRWTGRYVLQAAIVILGGTLSLRAVAVVGARTLPVMVGTLAAALLVAWGLGRALGIGSSLRTLIGVGTGICGASAIAAVSGVITTTEADIAYAMSAIFVFNLVAVLLFPPIGHLLGMSQRGFGLWAGTAVNDTSSVVATGYAYGHAAGVQAVIVKLTRTTMIIPIVAVLAGIAGSERGVRWIRVVPWFLVWFIAASVLATAGLVPMSWHAPLAAIAVALIAMALAAIGLSTHLGDMRRAGIRPLVLGTAVWVAVAVTSLGLQIATGGW